VSWTGLLGLIKPFHPKADEERQPILLRDEGAYRRRCRVGTG
jgi:hypothetical protein